MTPQNAASRSKPTLDLSSLSPRELGAAVTPLFVLDNRFQQAALNELVSRCEVAERRSTLYGTQA